MIDSQKPIVNVAFNNFTKFLNPRSNFFLQLILSLDSFRTMIGDMQKMAKKMVVHHPIVRKILNFRLLRFESILEEIVK